MSHLPSGNEYHRYIGDSLEIQVTVTGLTAGQVTVARFACKTVVKTIGDGITVTDDDGTARLDITLDKEDTEAIGEKAHSWQVAAGGTDPPIVAVGSLTLDPRL